jgi:hypothetical protein
MERHAGKSEPKRWPYWTVLLALACFALFVPACTWNELFSWNDGKPVLFGYGTTPNYDKRYKTVRIKIFKNPTFWSVVPVPGLEMELTQALVRTIEQMTPWKVVQGDADLEISGSIRAFQKLILNYTQQNEQRDVETTLTVEVIWKDLRTGELLSSAAPRVAEPPPPAGLLPNQADPLNAMPTVPGTAQPPLITGPAFPGGQPATMAAGSAQPPPTPGVPFQGQTSSPGPPGGPPLPPAPGAAPILGAIVRSIADYRPEIGQSISTAMQDNVNQMAVQIVSMMEKGW